MSKECKRSVNSCKKSVKSMLFVEIMSKRKIYIIGSFTILVFLTGMILGFNNPPDNFTGKVKVSLRAIGHQLLLANSDSTSLVLPISEIGNRKFQISFENELSVKPGSLVSIVKKNIEKATLPTNYIVEVIRCSDKEVVYSYEMKLDEENSIIPCFGRVLETNCYTINFMFIDKTTSFNDEQAIFIILFLFVLLLLIFIYFRRKSTIEPGVSKEVYSSIGCFQFYPDQNKLVKEAQEISLSKKECELLVLFIAHPNQIIKRDELTKKVWEDHGVIVGRSLDTYISKLRKKLKEDTSIKISNVHGVGYKLEINNKH